jgi:hypothetical protein
MSAHRSDSSKAHWYLLGIIVFAIVVYGAGIRKNLPYVYEVDEEMFVPRVVDMAAKGTLDPGWFGHPGSTIFYPLLVLFHVRYRLSTGGLLTWPDPGMLAFFNANITPFYLAGRLLSIAYALLSIPLLYLIGRKVFNPRCGLVGCVLFVLYPLVVSHAQMVRSDSAAVFFGLLSLWCILKVYERPTWSNQLLTGICIGLCVSSRYFMIILALVLLVVDGWWLWRAKKAHTVEEGGFAPVSLPAGRKSLWLPAALGIIAVGAGFALSTPYFFLDLHTALGSLANESRTIHLGADGLSRPGNLLFYLTQVIPDTLTLPQVCLAVVGLAIVLIHRKVLQILLFFYTVIFLLAISLLALHWPRWIIPILPVLALFTAYGLEELVGWIANRSLFAKWNGARSSLFLVGLVALNLWPGYQLALFEVQQINPSTRVLARQWALAHLPPNSKIVEEWYTIPLAETGFKVDERYALAERPDLDYYSKRGYDYLVVSSFMYERYLAEPQRYARESQFYLTLFNKGHLIYRIQPSRLHGGPIILVYKLHRKPKS